MNVLTHCSLKWTEAEWDYLNGALAALVGPMTTEILTDCNQVQSRQLFEVQIINSCPKASEASLHHLLSWVIINEQFLKRCYRTLAKTVGPIAPWLIEYYCHPLETESPQQWVEVLANQIPNHQLAENFRRQMLVYSELSSSL